jgi:HrpA-like RNA helicase
VLGAIEHRTHKITRKGALMSEIPYDPDFAHMIASALIYGDLSLARFLLAAGAFGDSLNHAYKSDHENMARELLYGFDRSNELNIKAHLLKRFSEDADGSFGSRLARTGIFHRYVEEAAKNYEAARDSLNDLLEESKAEPIPPEVVVDPDLLLLESYLGDCLSFQRFEHYQRREFDLPNLYIDDHFYAR